MVIFYKNYRERIWDAPIWKDTKDISSWDLSPEGAAEINTGVRASEDIYYFSWANEESINYFKENWYFPELGMNPFLLGSTLFLGAHIDSE
jgi:triacylglycerol lipase